MNKGDRTNGNLGAKMNKMHQQGFKCSCGCCDEELACIEKYDCGVFKRFGLEIIKIILSAIICAIGVIFFKENALFTYICIASALAVGYELLLKTIKNLLKGRVFDENLLMVLASVASFCIGFSLEGVLIIWLFGVGELLEKIATGKAVKRISGLSEIRRIGVHQFNNTGVLDVLPETVEVGAFLEIRNGEMIAIDSVLVAGNAVFDVKAVTGESNILEAKGGDEILSGAINLGDSIVVKTIRLYKDSTVEKIISMVEESSAGKAKSQKFITVFSKYYTPIITIFALFVAFVVPIFDGFDFYKWIYKSLSFIVISCPCALVISVPLAFFVGIGSFAKKGVLVKGSNYIELLARCNVVVFDKTGTLTKGNIKVVDIKCKNEWSLSELKKYVCAIESKSNHPISKALSKEFKEYNVYQATNVKEIMGCGIKGMVNGKSVLVGNFKLMIKEQVEASFEESDTFIIYVAVDNAIVGEIYLSDQIKSEAKQVINDLKDVGIEKTFVLSGDKKCVVEKLREDLKIDYAYAELLPEDKVDALNKIKEELSPTIYVGDGINDSPTLASADVGISMGRIGSDIAIGSSDVIILDDNLNKIPLLIRGSKKIRTIVFQNIIGSLLMKFSIMVLSFFITLPVVLSIFADVGVMLFAVLNSIRSGVVD